MRNGNDSEKNNYELLLQHIGTALRQGRQQMATAVNTAMVQTYWHIEYIVEYEQQDKERAEYGCGLINRLSHDLTERCINPNGSLDSDMVSDFVFEQICSVCEGA